MRTADREPPAQLRPSESGCSAYTLRNAADAAAVAAAVMTVARGGGVAEAASSWEGGEARQLELRELRMRPRG